MSKVSNIGGQALLEGVMMRGPSSMAMSVRDSDGIIRTESERLKPQRWYNRVPLIRGVVAFVASLVMGISTITRSAKVLASEEEEVSNTAMTFAVFLGVLFAVLLFMVLPEVLARLFNDYVFDNVLVKSLISGFVRIVIFVVYLLLVSKIKDIKRTFMYHGAEHRTINCYESGMELTVENIQKCSTRHNRCGTTFLFIVMVVSIIVFAFINWGLSAIFDGVFNSNILEAFVFILIKLAFLPLVAGISYEVLKALAKHENAFTRALRAPGLALQGLTTKIPTDDMAEVAMRSFLTTLRLENDKNAPVHSFDKIDVTDAKAYIRRNLSSAEPVEAEWIMCEVLHIDKAQLSMLIQITSEQFESIKQMCSRRKAGEPLDYITGMSNFYGYPVFVNKNVLIPRMETEILAEEAIKLIGTEPLDVLDMCTGSGCIALALAKKTPAHVVASDISVDALQVASKNLAGTGVELRQSDLFSQFAGSSFDMIVCNPPYIPSGDIPLLSPEVRCQPLLALDGGDDGLYFYKKIVTSAAGYLKSGGKLLLEIGYDQASSVSNLMHFFGFTDINVIKDLDGNDRVIIGQV